MGLLRRGAVRHSLVRKLRRARHSTLAELQDGCEHLLIGCVIRHEEVLTSPMTERTCVCFEAKVTTPDYDGGWAENLNVSRGVPFCLDDGSGEVAVVDATAASIVLSLTCVTEPSARFLAEHSIAQTPGLWGTSPGLGLSRFEEGLLVEGDEVVVLGRGVREPDPTGARRVLGYRQLPPTRLMLTSGQSHDLVVTNIVGGDLLRTRST